MITLEQQIIIFGIVLVVFAAAIALSRVPKIIREWKKHLKRHTLNPIFSPPPYSDWEAVGTFNPAAVRDDNGNIHIIYRAVGSDGVSRFGYGRSEDGYTFTEKSPYPVFAMSNPRTGTEDLPAGRQEFDPVMYPSGGSWGGAEDPRLVRIDGRIYLTFSAFDGWDFIRIAVSHIDEEDFFNRRWKWSKPLLISPPGQIHKNWVLFPEKINGKFAVLHSINPEVRIDYVNRFEDLSYGFQKIQSEYQNKIKSGEVKRWETWVRGIGPPPVKTDKGWLVLYHAIEKSEPHAYKLGALLLDLKDPRKVIARSPEPLLFPSEWYENDWKPGIIYACGAVIQGDNLLVYYGGGDKHVCVSEMPLSDLYDLLFKK